MKKVKFNGKLSLNKETIAKLNDEQMNVVNGGATARGCTTLARSCNTCVVNCTVVSNPQTCGGVICL